MNDWYIDRSKNFINDTFDAMLQCFATLDKDSNDTNVLVERINVSGALGNASGNPNAALTRYRDHGLLSKQNAIGSSALDYIHGYLSKGELIIDLFLKRPASKQNSPNVKPLVMLCKVFDIMMDVVSDPDDIFITFAECYEYLYPCNSYGDISYELVDAIVTNRNYSTETGHYIDRVQLLDNEQTNLSIWFNALRETPLFMPQDENRNTLVPNMKQREFFRFISVNADEFSETPTSSNNELYTYYCERSTGLLEVLPKVIIPSATIVDDGDAKILFEYLFGYKKYASYDYGKYIKYNCFGIFFPFITVPRLAIRQISLSNKQIGDALLSLIKSENPYIAMYDNGLFEYKGHFDNSVLFDENESLTEIGENIILYGVPGCGKSHTIKKDFCNDPRYMERVVFHPDYTCSDFIGQILPVITNVNGKENISYKFTPGPFTKILKDATNDVAGKMHYLVIEEINRGNAPAIFGEVFQLLDRENGESEYGITNFEIAKEVYGHKNIEIKIPRNLTILATMNTADQNVFTLDTAFKRRWVMRSIKNDIAACEHADECIAGTNVTWYSFAKKINDTIIDISDGNLSSEDNRLGAYFVKSDDLKSRKTFGEKVLMYLWNDAFKYDRDVIFNSEYKTLEDLLDAFEEKGFEVFNSNIKFNEGASKENVVPDVSEYLVNKKPHLIGLYERAKEMIEERIPNTRVYTTPSKQYIGFGSADNKKKSFAEVIIKLDSLSFELEKPRTSELQRLGSEIEYNGSHDHYFRITVTSEDELVELVDAIVDSYEQLKG